MSYVGRWVAEIAARFRDACRHASSRKSRSRRPARRALRFGLEGLERREVLSTIGAPPIAEIPGRVETPGQAVEVRFRLEPGTFVSDRTMPMLLALEAEPVDGSSAQVQVTHIVSLQGRNTYNLPTFRGPTVTNVAVPNARSTAYGLGVRAMDRTTGDFVVKVSLPGDTNGDGVVDRTDIGRIRAAYGTKAGDPRYEPGADTNGDGRVGFVDYSLARRNLGARASVVILQSPAAPGARRGG